MHTHPSKLSAALSKKKVSIILSAALFAMCSLNAHSQEVNGYSAVAESAYAAKNNVQISSAPIIVQHPQDHTAPVDNDASFSVVATPGANTPANTQLWYQWQIIDDEDGDMTWSHWKNTGNWTQTPRLYFKEVQNINNATKVRVIVANHSANGWSFTASNPAWLIVMIQIDPQE